MVDFFSGQKPKVVGGLNLLPIKNYKDIHQATLQVLEKTGIFVEDQTTRELFGSSGARVDEKSFIVKMPAAMVEEAIESAPAQVTLEGRTPDRDVHLDNNHSAYLNFGGGINIVDIVALGIITGGKHGNFFIRSNGRCSKLRTAVIGCRANRQRSLSTYRYRDLTGSIIGCRGVIGDDCA